MIRLAVICTHPIQYYAPVFATLSANANLAIKVFYGWEGATKPTFDPKFGEVITWDIPLLQGYEYEFVTNVAKVPGSQRFSGIDLPGLIGAIEAWGADAILIYGWCHKTHLRAMRYFHGRIPVLFRGDSTLLNERPGLRKLLRRLFLTWVYRHIDCGLYVGTNNRKYYEAHGVRGDKLVFAPHSIDDQVFRATAKSTDSESASISEIRKQFGIPETDVLFLYVGKFEKVKATELLLQAFSSLPPNAHLIMVGSGPLESTLRSLAGSNVHFAGFQNQTQLPNYYHAADLVILPSFSETWGLVVNEAMLSGRAVIVSNKVGCAVDLIEPDGNGWIFESGNQQSLESCLAQAVAAGRTRLTAFGQRSQEIIQDWSIQCQASAITDAVVKAVETRRPAALAKLKRFS